MTARLTRSGRFSVLALVCAVRLSAQGAQLPRSTPETQGISSAAILSFVQAADTGVDAMNSFSRSGAAGLPSRRRTVATPSSDSY